MCEQCGRGLGVFVDSPAGPETHKNLAAAQVLSFWPGADAERAVKEHDASCPALATP